MTTYIDVPVSKLALSERYQARKTPGQQPIEALAQTIYSQGLLQNLVVTKSKKRGQYEVVAGGRRLAAMQLLIKDGRWVKDQAVTVKVVENEHALEASLTENIHRENMHPADEFEAFSKLINQRVSIEDVAARHGVTPHVVKGRMKLAAVAPELIQAYRNGETNLAALMGFAITDDHERQLAVWNQLDHWEKTNGSTAIIRRYFVQETVTADDGLAVFVGIDAYTAAGGAVTNDLFSDPNDPSGIYLQDVELLRTLAQEKLTPEVERLGQGWAWAAGALSFQEASWADYTSNFGRIHAKARKLTKDEASRVKELTTKIDAISAQMDSIADSDDDDDQWFKLESELETLDQERTQIHETAKSWPEEAKKVAGVGVFVSNDGSLNVAYGLIRPEDRKAAQAAAQQDGEGDSDFTASLPAPVTRPVHSERLVRQLSANKVGIVGVELAARPDIALAVLVAQLARNTFGKGYFGCGDYGLGISLKTEALDQHAPDFANSMAGVKMDAYRLHWQDILPLNEADDKGHDFLQWALGQDTATLLELLAFILGTSVQGVQHQEASKATTLDSLGQVLNLDPANWWTPTADSYLNHVSKDQIVSAVSDALDADTAAPISKLKKGQAVEEAEKMLATTRWLPGLLRIVTA